MHNKVFKALLVYLLLVSPRVGFALEPCITPTMAAELVRDALASLGDDGGGTKIAVEPWLYYRAPDFITLQAQVFIPSIQRIAVKYFAVNPWTGDVWEPFACTVVTSPTLKIKQDAIWKSAKLPEEARSVLSSRTPACSPTKLRRVH